MATSYDDPETIVNRALGNPDRVLSLDGADTLETRTR